MYAQGTSLSNVPEKMKRAGHDVHFHHQGSALNVSKSSVGHSYHGGSHELDAQAMRNVLTQLFVKTLDMKKKKKENPHYHYKGVFRDFANIDKPIAVTTNYSEDTLTVKSNSREKETLESTKYVYFLQ